MPERCERLLEYPQVKEWIQTYSSRETQISYLRALNYLLETINLDPLGFLALDPKEARARTWTVIQDLIAKEKQPFAQVLKYGVASFYNHHHEDSPLKWAKRQYNFTIPVKKQSSKRIPVHEEVWKLVDSTHNIRDKAIIALMYNTGLGHQAIVNLNYGDVRYLLEKTEYPLEMQIDPRIYPKRFRGSNGVSSYVVLLDRDCADLLRLHCSKVHKDSSEDTPLFQSNKGKRMRRFDITFQLNRAIQEVFPGEKGRTWPYLLRNSFYNRLIEGQMTDTHREYLMGHDLGMRQHYYDVNRREIREQYLRCHFNRVVSKTDEVTRLEKELEEERKKRIELEERIGRMAEALEFITSTPARKVLEDLGYPSESSKKRVSSESKSTKGEDCDHIVSKDQLQTFLDQGWRYVDRIGSNQFIVRR